MNAWQSQQAQLPQQFDASDDYAAYQRVILIGHYLTEKFWLKENQAVNGQLGYNVIMPFKTLAGDLVVVDRGWVLGSPYRDFVPQIDTPEAEIRISGTLVVPSNSKLIREAEVSAKTWPHKILEVDTPVMSKQLDASIYPKLVKIDADSPSALVVHWQPINMSPAKHYGYATQWGLLAVALVLLYVFASTNLAALVKSLFRNRRDV